jgi:hypothetical protein
LALAQRKKRGGGRARVPTQCERVREQEAELDNRICRAVDDKKICWRDG